jgi:uncharacterized protein
LWAGKPKRHSGAFSSMTGRVTDNPERGRFELDVNGQTVFARYSRQGSTLVIPYVEAPPALRGKGAASRLMAGVMEIARAERLKVRPLCSYASAWMWRHPAYRDLLA